MLLRYGWGLEPSQVCGLVKGLSPRAYRKEITRGVDEVTERMRAVERGSWCTDREPLLKVYAAGLADADQERQARAHLAHCRHCSEFVGRLSGHLHDLGGAVAAVGSLDAIDGHLGVGDRLADLGDRVGGLVARGGRAPAKASPRPAVRGRGRRGSGVLTKLAGLGTAGKIAIACAGGGMAATACVAAGVAPFGLDGDPDAGYRADEARAQRPAPSGAAAPPLAARPDPPFPGWQRLGPDPAPPRRLQARCRRRRSSETAPAPEPARRRPRRPATVPTTASPTEQELSVSAAAVARRARASSSSRARDQRRRQPGERIQRRQEFGP